MSLRSTLTKAAVGAVAVTGVLSAATGVADAGPTYNVVNADGGVYWRNSPNWNDTNRITGQGVYNGDQLDLKCWEYGTSAGSYSPNPLWYYAYSYTRNQWGWVNDHYLTTPGTAASPQPQGYPC